MGELAVFLASDKAGFINGEDMIFVTVSVTDRHGILCADRTPLVKFTLKGSALKMLAADGGDPTSLEPFGTPECTLFSGKAVVYLQSSGEAGETVLHAESEGLKGAEINISALDLIPPQRSRKN